MYVAVIPNRSSPPAILLRESYREAGKTKNRTLANLSRWPAERIAQLRAVLRVKTVDLELRPVFHWTAPRVRAHVLLCMLAY
jgi:hypothetical protein